MATKVAFQNPKTGETKTVKAGFSWVLLFFSGVFGLPLFLRGLHIWGGIMAGLWGFNLLIQALLIDTGAGQTATIPITLFVLGLSVWFGIKGNEMTAKNYLEKGWKTLETDSDAVKHARNKWGLSEILPADSDRNGDGTTATPAIVINEAETAPVNTETKNEAGQERKSYAAKPRSFKSIFYPHPVPFGFSRQARQRRKEMREELREELQKAEDEFWSLSGRASRSEFWWTVGGFFLLSMVLTALIIIFDNDSTILASLAAIVFWCSIPVTVRRFHDMGNSGWWTVPVIGPTVAYDILNILDMLYNDNLLYISLVCLIVGYIVLSRKGTPEKTRFDKDD